jgi:multidrug resistance efflux pump
MAENAKKKELTPEEELAQLKTQLAEANSTIEQLKADVSTAKAEVPESAAQQIEQLTAAVEELAAENKKQAFISNASGSKLNCIEIEGKIYKAVGKSLVMLDKSGQRFELLATALEDHREICEDLIANGSGFLVELEN